MRGTWAILKRELRLYFTSPIAYVITTMYLLICGYFFHYIFLVYSDQISIAAMQQRGMTENLNVTEFVFRNLFNNMVVFILFMVPMLTMRLFAEERKSGTAELLLTYPLRDGEVVMGKFLSSLVVYAVMIGLTLVYPLLVNQFSEGRLEWSTVCGGYLGLLLVGAAFCAMGIWFSSLTENQVVAAAVTFGALLLLYVLGWAGDQATGVYQKWLKGLAVYEHVQESFNKGIVDTGDLAYFVCFTAFFIFLTLRVLESNKWRA